ncbi:MULTISPECIES: CsiV family protein [unclassified Pseudoalteromonas]|uniref:CsiV family protein n=1 Tax=unclassified Pseudoalteromonas TaxID=194690 RepID=UPI001F44046A|nr:MULTISPECIES: CsiV family protein [unclassified Pseudoalteromonas]MCF2899965.1 peptidoglycan binding protein CsiV [Pseudoalteromonas sp. OFAV1]MCO7249725.1 peptidoglycan binding protein CsiV [Pseudoalteromonas sp. Ps84H-4]
MLLRNSFLLLCCLFTSSSFATRWFEIEVLIYKQRPAPYLQEDFSLKHDEITAKREKDLLSPAYTAQARQECLNGDSRFQSTTFADAIITSNPHSNVCDESVDYLSSYDELPVTPVVEARDDTDEIYLLAPEQLQFIEQKKQLDRKGLTPILHTGWRFPEMSESKAPSIRLFSGDHFSQALDSQATTDNDFINLVSPVQQYIPEQLQTIPKWELEGLMKIYVRHYLFIHADFDISQRLESGDYEKARFSQFKRVISNEIHYFDHPRMGMIVQIRRYNH